jgi:hypothetical protein
MVNLTKSINKGIQALQNRPPAGMLNYQHAPPPVPAFPANSSVSQSSHHNSGYMHAMGMQRQFNKHE